MASTYELLEKAERVELTAERIYRSLAGRFGGEPKALFLRLAGEEAQHAARVRLLAARYRHDKRLVKAVATDLSLVERLLAEAGEALQSVEAGAWDGDPAAALGSAVALERRFCEVHAQLLSKDGHPELRAFFDQLASQDQAHLELLGPLPAPARA